MQATRNVFDNMFPYTYEEKPALQPLIIHWL